MILKPQCEDCKSTELEGDAEGTLYCSKCGIVQEESIIDLSAFSLVQECNKKDKHGKLTVSFHKLRKWSFKDSEKRIKKKLENNLNTIDYIINKLKTDKELNIILKEQGKRFFIRFYKDNVKKRNIGYDKIIFSQLIGLLLSYINIIQHKIEKSESFKEITELKQGRELIDKSLKELENLYKDLFEGGLKYIKKEHSEMTKCFNQDLKSKKIPVKFFSYDINKLDRNCKYVNEDPIKFFDELIETNTFVEDYEKKEIIKEIVGRGFKLARTYLNQIIPTQDLRKKTGLVGVYCYLVCREIGDKLDSVGLINYFRRFLGRETLSIYPTKQKKWMDFFDIKGNRFKEHINLFKKTKVKYEKTNSNEFITNLDF